MGERQRVDLQIIKNAINQCVDVRKTDVAVDKTGVDYIATLENGATIGIDAKARERGASRYWKTGEAELALEIWSVVSKDTAKRKIGWTLSSSTNVDMILYTFDPSDWTKFYLLPFQHLRMAFYRNGREWLKRYGSKKQTSDGWQSEALFVPASVVLSAIMDCMKYEGNGV